MADERSNRDSQNSQDVAKTGSSGAGRGQLNDAEESQVNEDHNLSGASTWETLNGHQTNLEEEERNRDRRDQST